MNNKFELEQEEGSGYLVSVSDLMSALVFIFIISLVAFILNFQEATAKLEGEISGLNTIQKRMESNDYARSLLLKELQDKLLKQHQLSVAIDEEHGVLRLTENSITFASGSDHLNDDNLKKLVVIRKVLEAVIPCYSANLSNVREYSNCSREEEHQHAYLEAVFIEGHTDNTRFAGDKSGERNWELSVNRAIKTYMELVSNSTVLGTMKNSNDEVLFSVSGYGENRPLEGHRHEIPTDDTANRRIDLRFIMTPPSFTDVEKKILKQRSEK